MIKTCSYMIVLVLAPMVVARAGVVVDHSANRTNWRISDTSTSFGTWQLVADDFTLDAPATVRHITWWGLYEQDSPPNPVAMRMRLYGARQSDGLPGAVIFEDRLLNPSRTLTGQIINNFPAGSSLTAAEQQFESDLPTSISLDAHITYWLEIVEDGAPGATFAWRGANAEGAGRAVINAIYGDWSRGSDFDMAFRLSTVPEPTTVIMVVIGFGWASRRAGRRLA